MTNPPLSQAGALLLPKDFVSFTSNLIKVHFHSYTPNRTMFFLQKNDLVSMIDALVESLNLENFRKLYKERSHSPYHPKMMLKVILHAHMNKRFKRFFIQESVGLVGAEDLKILYDPVNR